MTLTDHDNDGVLGPEYLDWMDWDDDYYDSPDYLLDYNDYWCVSYLALERFLLFILSMYSIEMTPMNTRHRFSY